MRFTAAQRHAAWFLLTAPSASAGRQGSDHAFFDEDLERSAGDGASERVAAESTAVLARFQHAEDLVVREHRRYRKARRRRSWPAAAYYYHRRRRHEICGFEIFSTVRGSECELIQRAFNETLRVPLAVTVDATLRIGLQP